MVEDNNHLFTLINDKNYDEAIKILYSRAYINPILENRATVKNEGRDWWKYSRPLHYEYYNLDKIWCSYRSKNNCFAYDDTNQFIGFTNTTVIFDTNTNINLKYLLALLNSKTLDFRYKSIGKQTGNGIFEYFENGIGKLAIPDISLEQQKPFIKIIDKILAVKETDNDADISIYETEIDQMVYALYDLTNEEIKIIESINRDSSVN